MFVWVTLAFSTMASGMVGLLRSFKVLGLAFEIWEVEGEKEQ